MIDKDENRSAQDSEKEINVRSRPRFFAVAQQAYDSSTDIDEKYVCQICFESRKVKAFETFKLKNCGHPYCKICLSSYVAHKVAHGEVYPVCFISIGVDEALNEKICGCVIEESDIDTLLYEDSTSTMKYQRFKMSKENSNLRFCSKCEGPRVGSFDSPAMTCSNCGHKYCFVHGDAHDSTVMCVDYELAIAEESGKTKELLELTTKPCPNCKSPIEKAGGCNQMKCYNCNIHFCWLCGKKVDDGTFPAHFEWWNVAGCPNRQMEEQGATERSESRRICVRVVSIFQVFFLGPPAFVLTVVSSILCCCFLPMLEDPPMQIFSGCMTIWGYVVMAVLLFPFVIAFGTPILIGLGMVWCASTGYIRLMEYIASLKPSPPPFRAGTPMPVNPISRRSQFFDTSPDLERGLGANSV